MAHLRMRQNGLLWKEFSNQDVARQVHGDVVELHDDPLLQFRKCLDELSLEVRRYI